MSFTEDSKSVYITAEASGDTRALYLYNTKTTEAKKIYHDKSVDIGSVIFDFKNDKVVAVSTEETYPKYRYLLGNDKKAKIHKTLIEGFEGQDVVIHSVSRDRKKFIIYTYADNHSTKFYLFETNNLNNGSYILNTRPWIDPELMSTVKAIDITTRDGVEINGYLTWPNTKETKNLPLVVVPHGGPHGVRDYWGFDWEIQLLASRGYAVLQVNYRGSGGFGRKFQQAGYLGWGTFMQDDITDATKALIERKIADPNRICIYGSSYGGYAALMGTIREPELYKCAIGSMGVYDLPMMFEEGKLAERAKTLAYLDEVLGNDMEDLKTRSPVYNVEKIKADVMLIHGRKDERVPIEHAHILIEAFEEINKPVEWLEIKNEGHGFEDAKNRLKVYKKILTFLERNIGSKN